MSLRKKTLFFLTMLALTLVAVEGMAQAAYWLAYDETYQRKQLLAMVGDAVGDADIPLPGQKGVLHPFFGYTYPGRKALNVITPQRKREGSVVIGLLGGSVARNTHAQFKEAITRHVIDSEIDLKPVVINLAEEGMKQPQQSIIVAYMLILGGEFDMLVNLDGYNETMMTVTNARNGIFPFFPHQWSSQVGMTAGQTLLAGHVKVLRDAQAALLDWTRESPWFRSAAFGLAARARLNGIESRIHNLHHELAESDGSWSLEKHGPRAGAYRNEETIRRASARVWYRGSVLLANLARHVGAEYYHFLQPNQYIPGSKPLTSKELASAYSSNSWKEENWRESYPLLLRIGNELRKQNIDYFDLTQIFSNNHETLYRDICCHFNRRGRELLADAMLRRILETTNVPGLACSGDRLPTSRLSNTALYRFLEESKPAVCAESFTVYHYEDRLFYVGSTCDGTGPQPIGPDGARFFLHVFPVDRDDLPVPSRSHGFVNLDSRFHDNSVYDTEACVATVRLPPYEIAGFRTGQYVPGKKGGLWEGEVRFDE